jgi:hypothetical protein
MERDVISRWRRAYGAVQVVCPGCGAELPLNHEVADSGDVNPSLDCPLCDYHRYVTLAGWPGKERQEAET